MKKLSLLALLTLLAACKDPQPEGEALRARVMLTPAVSATCVLFEVRDAASHQVLARQWLPRGDDELTVAVFRGSLPAEVELAARPYRDGTCQGGQEARTPNGAYATVTAAFVAGTVTEPAALSLKPGTDGDADGYVDAASGGADCDDAARTVNPGAQETCSDRVDLTCDGKRGCEASTCAATACIAPPASLSLTVPTGSVVAGTCQTASVAVKDADGVATRATSATSVNLEAAPFSGGAFFSDASCTLSLSSVTIPATEGGASFFFMPRGVGTVTLTASSTGLTSASQGVTVVPGAGSRLVLLAPLPPTTVTSGACSAQVRVQLQDALGNPVNVSADTQVNLGTAPADGFQFFTDSACTGSAVTAATMTAGQSVASFYFKGVRAGSATLSASIGSTSVSHTATINAGAPAALLFPQSPLTLAAGVCTPVTLEVKDAAGNAATSGAGRNVSLSATTSPGGVTIASNATCTTTATQVNVPAGQSSATFYVSGQAQGSVTVTATAAGLSNGTLAVTVNPGAPKQLAFVTAQQTVERGACSGVATVEVRDSGNNPTQFTTAGQLGLAANPVADTTFFSDSGCTAPTGTLPVAVGQSRASFYFKDNKVETVTLTVSQAGLTSATQQQTITPAKPTALVFTTPARTALAGICSGAMTVEARALGSVTTVASATQVDLVATAPDTEFKFYSNNNCSTSATQVTIAAGQSTATFYFTGTKVGTVGVTASNPSVATSANQDATITAAAPSKLQFLTGQHSVKAGVCSPVVTFQTTDAYGNVSAVAANKAVSLSATGTPADPNFRFFSDEFCTANVTSVTVASGQSTASFYFKGEKARTATITATPGGFTPATYTQDHTITVAQPVALAFSTAAQTVLAGTCAPVTVERRDAYGNATPDAVTLDLSASVAGTEFFADAGCATPITQLSVAEGNTASFYFKGYTGGINATAPLILTAKASGLTDGNQTEAIIPTVRSAQCTMNGNQASVTCTIAPGLASTSRAMLTFQATTTNTASKDANIRCALLSATQVKCDRVDNKGANILIRWTVAEFPASSPEVRVQHQDVSCAGDLSSVSLSAVTPERSFLLLSSQRGGADQGSAVPRLAELTTTTQAEIRKTGGCVAGDLDINNLQAVDYPGASVQRGLSSLTSGTNTQFALPTAVAMDRSILLYSYIYGGTATKLCDRALRGELVDNGASVRFSRGEGDATNCAGMQLNSISWEVVQFPPGTLVQQVTKQLTALTTNVTLGTPVDRSRTLLLAGGQWASGQALGEGSHAGATTLSDLRVEAELTDSSTLKLTRQSQDSSATFTVYVVQLKP